MLVGVAGAHAEVCQHKVCVEQLKDTFLFSQARLVHTAKQKEYRSTLPKMKGCRSKAVLEANKEAVKAVFLFSHSCGNADASIFTGHCHRDHRSRRFHLEDDALLGAVRSGRQGVGAVPVWRSCVAGTASASLSRRHRRQLVCGPTARGLSAFRNAAGTTCKRSEHCNCVQAACGPQFTVVCCATRVGC